MSQLSDFYQQATGYIEKYLDGLKLPESGKDILAAELEPYRRGDKPQSMDKPGGIYFKMLKSLQNRQGFLNFIGLDAVEHMNDILFDFDPLKVHPTYGKDFEGLFEKLKARFPDKKFDMQNSQSAWFQYTKGIVSIAKFLSDFKDHREFNAFVESFSFNEHAVAALPMLLEKEIHGYGFALSCDFLKEAGYNAYGKPDVHLLDIFADGGIIAEKNEFECFKAMVKMAREVGEPASVVDKVFWIIGSGKFNEYNRKNAKKIPVKRLKDDFAEQYGQKAPPASA